ncbi:MAG: DUF1801 domain-containing protein [Flavobacteriales bacterium]|nr:DUF1801 domain-containing protein [Flavobacteriales bacterium]
MKNADPEIELYYGSLPGDRRDALLAIRKLIRRTWPTTSEDMAYGMPTFHLDGLPLFAIASQKHFMALYVMPYDLLDAFKNDLKVYDRGKSCIRFKRLETPTFDLFDRIIKYVGNQQALSKSMARPAGQKKQLVRS